MDRYMSDHKDRMEHSEVEGIYRDVEYKSLDRMSQKSRDNYFYNLGAKQVLATKHNEVEGLVEATEAVLQNLSFWNVLDTDEQCELRTALTTHGAKEREAEGKRIWSALCDLTEPDERQFGAGELHTHLDDVYKIIRPQTDVTKN